MHLVKGETDVCGVECLNWIVFHSWLFKNWRNHSVFKSLWSFWIFASVLALLSCYHSKRVGFFYVKVWNVNKKVIQIILIWLWFVSLSPCNTFTYGPRRRLYSTKMHFISWVLAPNWTCMLVHTVMGKVDTSCICACYNALRITITSPSALSFRTVTLNPHAAFGTVPSRSQVGVSAR